MSTKKKSAKKSSSDHITDSALKRITLKAGILKSKSDIYDFLRKVAHDLLIKLVRKSLYTMIFLTKRKEGGGYTLMFKHVDIALQTEGVHFGAILEQKTWIGLAHSRKAKPKKEKSEKPHKFKSGVRAAMKMRAQQKELVLSLPHASFSRHIKSIVSQAGLNIKDFRLGKEASFALQAAVEMYLLHLSRIAMLVAHQANRALPGYSDLKFAYDTHPSLKAMLCSLVNYEMPAELHY